MAHEYYGEQLKVGDFVLIPAVVKEIDGDEERGTNIVVETLHPAFPHEHKSAYSINSRQVERVDMDEESDHEDGPEGAEVVRTSSAISLTPPAPEVQS